MLQRGDKDDFYCVVFNLDRDDAFLNLTELEMYNSSLDTNDNIELMCDLFLLYTYSYSQLSANII